MTSTNPSCKAIEATLEYTRLFINCFDKKPSKVTFVGMLLNDDVRKMINMGLYLGSGKAQQSIEDLSNPQNGYTIKTEWKEVLKPGLDSNDGFIDALNSAKMDILIRDDRDDLVFPRDANTCDISEFQSQIEAIGEEWARMQAEM